MSMKRMLFLVGICVSTLVAGQCNTKMDYYLASRLLQCSSKQAGASVMVPMLVQGNINRIKQLVQANEGLFKYAYGNIASVVIPVSALSAFNESSAVTRMEGAPPHIRPCNDTLRLRNSIVAVQQGLSPLPRAYNGEGIVIGFVDTGIDFTHPDFIDSTGKTRVKYYWDMNQPVGIYTPKPYGYGQAWNQAEIDNGIANNSSATIEWGHGSNVAGAAASNGRANGQEIGGAPKCDIVMVAYNFNNQTASEITDAINYIYTVADSLHEPCVINASLGDYNGSHDGLDLQALMIDSMIMAKQPGRVFVAAAGNAGGIPYHLHDSLTQASDTSFTWFQYNAGNVDIPVFADTADFNNISFAIAVDKVGKGYYSKRGSTRFSTIKDFLSKVDTVYLKNAHGDPLGQIIYYAQQYYPGCYSMEYIIHTDSTNYYWRLITTGRGRFDAWALSSSGGTDIIDTTGLELSPVKYPVMKQYKEPDVNQTICSSFQCSQQVITVANYTNRQCWQDGNLVDTCLANNIPGTIAYNSSWGPTRNYRLIKPDIAGAGNNTLSALPLALKAGYLSGARGEIDSGGWHDLDGGTSLASPGVASVAALYMQRYPTAKYLDVWYALTHCDSVDKYTGAVPNYIFGYGKVDAFKALVGCIPTGVSEIVPADNGVVLKAYPNPSVSGRTTIQYDFSGIKQFSKAQLIFYNMLGKQVKTVSLGNSGGEVTLGENTLSAGMYFYSLAVDGLRLKTEKLEIL